MANTQQELTEDQKLKLLNDVLSKMLSNVKREEAHILVRGILAMEPRITEDGILYEVRLVIHLQQPE